jgi:putative endonuclease
MNQFYVYILASRKDGVLYIGVTNDLARRVFEHKQGLVDSFTEKYKIHRLVYYEQCVDIRSAISREKQLKRWNRQWKIKLIESTNPDWQDLSDALCG